MNFNQQKQLRRFQIMVQYTVNFRMNKDERKLFLWKVSMTETELKILKESAYLKN